MSSEGEADGPERGGGRERSTMVIYQLRGAAREEGNGLGCGWSAVASVTSMGRGNTGRTTGRVGRGGGD